MVEVGGRGGSGSERSEEVVQVLSGIWRMSHHPSGAAECKSLTLSQGNGR
jgi:hypothetical protein